MLDQNARAGYPICRMYLYGHSDRPTVLDGAMGTELMLRGFDPASGSAEAWSGDRPEVVRAIHSSYVEAGAEVLQTNTFGAFGPRLAKWKLAEDLERLIRQSIDLARDAAGRLPVVGSLGPVAMSLGPAELTAAYARSGAALAGVDAIHLETQCDPTEMTAAVEALRRVSSVPLIVSVTAMIGSSGFETPTGVPLDRMLAALKKLAGLVDAVGLNCSLDAERMATPLDRVVDLGLPVWVRPQARSSHKCGPGMSSETPERFAERAAALASAGACAIGGCCGVGPRAIRALSDKVVGAMFAPHVEVGS